MSISSQKKENSESDRSPSKDENESSSSSSSSSTEEEKSGIKTSESAKSTNNQEKITKTERGKSVGLGFQDLIDGENLLFPPDLDYVTIVSQNKYFVEKDLVKDNSNIKADSYHLKDTNTLEKEILKFANPTSKKADKNELQSNLANVDENELLEDDEYEGAGINKLDKDYIDESYLQMYFEEEKISGENFIVNEDLKEGNSDSLKEYFLGNIEDTKDGYLLSRILKIEWDLNLIPNLSFFKFHDDSSTSGETSTNKKVEGVLQIESFEASKFLDRARFVFKKGNDVGQYTKGVNEFYANCRRDNINNPKIININLDFLEAIDDQTIENFEYLLTSFLKFEIWNIVLFFVHRWTANLTEKLLTFISNKDVKNVVFSGSAIDLSILWSTSKFSHNTKWRFQFCVLNIDNDFPLDEHLYCNFERIDFVKCSAIYKMDYSGAHDPIFNLSELNNYLWDFKARFSSEGLKKKIYSWDYCRRFVIQTHWKIPKHITHFVF
jgi:hypothetical protein